MIKTPIEYELLELLKKKSYQEGKFLLSSGKESNFFIDCKPVMLDPVGLEHCGYALSNLFHDELNYGYYNYIAGIAMGGIPLAHSISSYFYEFGTNINILYVRKKPKTHGTYHKIDGIVNVVDSCPEAVIVDDVITTGNSIIESVKDLRTFGIDVDVALCLVDRLEGGREKLKEHNIELRSVFDRYDFER